MHHRVLGRTGVEVSVVAFGAGPVPGLMTGNDLALQRAVLERAVAAGINWIDTAPGYGEGQSEASLGRALHELGVQERVHVATKVRLSVADLADVEGAVRRSLEGSLSRLQLPAVTLLQLHNGITARRGEIPASLTPSEVLGPGGVLEALHHVREDGLCRFVGLTGTGEPEALTAVVSTGGFDTIQVPHHLLAPADEGLLHACQHVQMGVFAIRVFAGGALVGQPPSAHTLRTPYFPLALYEEDRRRADDLAMALGPGRSLRELALRFVLSAPVPQIALVGLAAPEQVDEVCEWAAEGPLPPEWLARLAAATAER